MSMHRPLLSPLSTLLAASALALVPGCASDPTSAPEDTGMDAGPGDGDGGPPAPGAVTFTATPVFDERADAIAFTTGEPVHTHGGPTTPLVGEGCPDVYKHAYLLRRAPLYGREANANALAWRVRPPAAVPTPTAASYRVVTEAGEVLRDWATLVAASDDGYDIALHADEVPALLTREGALAVEVRFEDAAGVVFPGRQCWTHHPLAAPLELGAPALASTAERLTAMRLGIDPVAAFTNTSAARRVDVAEQRVVNHTAEPVAFTLDFTPPAGTFSKRVVEDIVQTSTASLSFNCTDVDPAVEDRCSLQPVPDPADETAAGALGDLAWTFTVVEDASGAPVSGCARLPRGRTCSLPARAAGAPAIAYRAVVSASDAQTVATAPGLDGEHAYLGLAFTGTVSPTKVYRCGRMRPILDANGEQIALQCVSNQVFTRFRALDQARVDLSAFDLQVATAIGEAVPTPVPMPAGRTVPALAWDGGNADLPGPQ